MNLLKKCLLIFIIIVSMLICSCTASDAKQSNIDQNNLVIDCIPVLGGDSFLIIIDGKSMLIDTGVRQAYNEIKATLNFYNIKKLDFVILTHYHKDHIGSMSDILSDFKVKKVLMIDQTHDSDTYSDLMQNLENIKQKIQYVKAGDSFNLGNSTFEILNPQKNLSKNMNDNSIVFKLNYVDKSFLFVGDLENKGEKQLLNNDYDLKSDFLKVGNHGEKDATSKKFLKAIDPEYAIISPKTIDSFSKTEEKLLDKDIKTQIVLLNDHIVYTSNGLVIKVQSYENFTY